MTTQDQFALLQDKLSLWSRASKEGAMDLRDYNGRCAEALHALLLASADSAATITRLEAEKAELLAGLRIFLGHDERFHVAVGGNPIAIDRMLGAARSLLSKLEGGE